MLPSFLSASSAWLFALLVPLIVFYFLKLKRPKQVIPSLVLWRQVLTDQRVNSPFQRFKRNLLLLLQILLLCLLALAAMQPVLRRESSKAERLPVLIDCSASMGALDKEGGQSRLDVAKARVRELIDGLPADQQICLIAFSKTARRLTGFTNNQTELRDALNAVDLEDVAGDLEEALRLTQALARSESFDRVRLYSDGNFPARANFELSYNIDFVRLADAATNFGITAFNARRALGGQWEVFVQLGGSLNAESASGTVELIANGQVIGSENVALVKGSAPRLAFAVPGNQPVQLQARYVANGFDSLASDNTAWINLPAARSVSVYVPKELTSFRHALAGIKELNLFPDESGATQQGYDLVISDKAADLTLPARVQCGIDLIPEELEPLVKIEKGNANVIDWRRDSPLLQHVSFEDVVMMDDPHRTPETTETDFRNRGYEILADGVHGPVVVEKREADAWRVHFFFHPDRSTLPYRVGFPVLMMNLVQAALKQSSLSEATAAKTGVLPTMTLAPNKTYRIEGPAKFRREEQTDSHGQLNGVAAPRTGEYTIAESGVTGAIAAKVGTALLASSETGLEAVDQIEFNDQLKVSASSIVPQADRSLWWPIALAAFFLLLVEWWWFNRRVVAA